MNSCTSIDCPFYSNNCRLTTCPKMYLKTVHYSDKPDYLPSSGLANYTTNSSISYINYTQTLTSERSDNKL